MPSRIAADSPRNRRARVLQAVFSWLYGPLAWLHEPAGRILFGAAWHGRRLALLDRSADQHGPLLDIGCGDGRLLRAAQHGRERAFGLEPSGAAALRAHRSGAHVVRALAQRMPFKHESFAVIVCSYPGPWIADPQVWDEIARVARPGASVIILLGGTYERGRFAWLRRLMVRVAYGAVPKDDGRFTQPELGNATVTGAFVSLPDQWGAAQYWQGTARASGRLVSPS